jgi:hypothetical protein
MDEKVMDEKAMAEDVDRIIKILRTTLGISKPEIPAQEPEIHEQKPGVLERFLFLLLGAFGKVLLAVGKILLCLFSKALGIVIGIVASIAVLLVTGLLAGGIVWLTWDHMHPFWSIFLALLSALTLVRMMPTSAWLTAEQEAMAERVAEGVSEAQKRKD